MRLAKGGNRMKVTRWGFSRILLAVVAVVLVGGCGVLDPIICTTEARPGLRVAVVDSVTGDTIPEATVVAEEGAYQETLNLYGGVAHGAYERAGTYRVDVTAAGYEPWSREGVQVTEDECHVRTVDITARLQE